jgi:WD repeat-containing protein 70
MKVSNVSDNLVFHISVCTVIVYLVWDLRNFRKPIVTSEGITTLYPGTNAIFSPDERYILTGTSMTEKGRKGQLLFLKREDLEKVASVELDSAVVKVLWHSRINQVSTEFAKADTRL